MDVTSFGIDHDKLLRGVYVSRKDKIGAETVTTFDVRIKEPNREPVVDMPVMHTLEHLIAVYLRSHAVWADKTIYVGPMGCRTGMYLIFKGDLNPMDVLPIISEAFRYCADFDGQVPATTAKECGNYLEHNLNMTRYESRIFVKLLENIGVENMEYPKLNS